MPAKGYRQDKCLRGHVRTPDNVDPKSGSCKECRAAVSKRWRQTPAGRAWHSAKQRQWAANNPDKVLNTKLKKSYGINLEEYKALIATQESRCLVCKTLFSERSMFGKDRPVVDHNHETGVVRGILCSNCNCGIGLLKDDPKVLQAAVEYLKA